MLITVNEKLTVDNTTLEFRKWCEGHLVLNNPEYTKKARMGFWLGKTPKQLYLYEKDGDSYILPYGCLREIPHSNSDLIVEAHHKPTKINYGDTDMKLYDYQKKAVIGLKEAKYGILQAGTGTGKTQVGIALIKEIGLKALWLTHTHDLLNQSYDRAKQYIDESLLGKITEGKVHIGKGITFATVQTLSKVDLSKYRDIWDVVIVDECHHAIATVSSVTMFSKVLSSLDAPYKYGLSATVHRSDGLIKATLALLGRVIYTISDEEVTDKIIKVGIKPIQTGIQIADSCLNVDGTLNYSSLITYLTENTTRNLVIVKNIIENKGHSCLILSDRLSHLEMLMGLLPKDMREDAVMISGKMTSKKGKAEREKAIQDMREGKKKYLFATFSLAKEGLDIPRLDRLFLASIIKDQAVVIQSIGRVARVSPNKKEAIAYDFVDDIGYCKGAYKKRCTSYKKVGSYII